MNLPKKASHKKGVMMKRKKLFLLLLVFCMAFTMMPSMAFAVDAGAQTPNTEAVNTNAEESAGTTTPTSGDQDSAQPDETMPDSGQEGTIPDEEQESAPARPQNI